MNEFLINGYLNLITASKSTDGEIMGASLSGFCIFLSSTILPLTIMWMICFKSKKQLLSKKFLQRYGTLFEGINLKWTSSRFYFFVFWARRMISICISLLINYKKGTIVLLVILFLNILYIIYIGRQKRLININLNFQERFNELIVSGCYYMMII